MGKVFGGGHGTVILAFGSIGVCVFTCAKKYKFMLSASDINRFFFPKANLIITITCLATSETVHSGCQGSVQQNRTSLLRRHEPSFQMRFQNTVPTYLLI